MAHEIAALTTHYHSEVRSAALTALFVTGRICEMRPLAVNAFTSDCEESVRATAAFAIAATSSDDSRLVDVQTLLPAVKSAEEPPEVRRAAYEALLIIFRRSDFPDPVEDFNPASDIDWPWIAQLESA